MTGKLELFDSGEVTFDFDKTLYHLAMILLKRVAIVHCKVRIKVDRRYECALLSNRRAIHNCNTTAILLKE